MSIKILKNIYKLKYIKFDYNKLNYHLIQCWKFNDNGNGNIKISNIDFIVNKRLNYIKINNLSINNDYYHNNKDEYYMDYYNDRCNKAVLLENNLIMNKNKFYVDIAMNENKIEINKIQIEDAKLKTNDYNLYNYNIEKIIDKDEYKIIKKIIFEYIYKYANYRKIDNITMSVNNNKKRYNFELKEEGFKIDYNYPFNSKLNLNIIKRI